MPNGLKLAICGKGGVGKTTVCAVWSQLFSQDGFDVMALDADSNPNLSLAFGMPAESRPQALIDMEELIEQRTGAPKGSAGQYFKMNPHVADLPEKYSLETAGVKLLVLGSIDQAGSGCACPEGAFLKAMLSHSMLHRQEMILVDLEAGVEFLGRASVMGVDALVVVLEPGRRSIETALNIKKMANEMGINHIACIVNKIVDDTQLVIVKEQLGDIIVLGGLKFDTGVQQADLQRQPVFQANPELVASLRQAKDKLMNEFFHAGQKN
ncbi:MAG: AAA family ATPase [Planctomycetes bacterium]|nr:AAA family ATPase [Planctomycetota bacterium]